MMEKNLFRQTCILVIVLLTLSIQTSALSLSGQKQYNASAYADALLEEQLQFTTKVNQIKKQMSNVRAIFDNTTITNNVKLVQASQGIADERNTLYDMQQILKLPWQLRECKCANLDQANRDKVNQKITYIKGLIEDMRSSLKKCDEVRCPRYEEIAMELSQSQNYLAIMSETINSECCKGDYKFKPELATGLVDLSNTIYKDNLNAKNWYYGDIDKTTYTLKRFELATKYNLTSCPLGSPYADLLSNICTDCLPQTSFFNLGSRTCITCTGYNKYLDFTTSQCKQCPFAQYYNKTSASCQNCPQGTIFNTSTIKCQPCTGINQYASVKDNKCLTCPQEFYYDKNSKVCKSCDIVGGMFLNKTTNQCEYCPHGTRYVVANKKCTACPKSFHYDISMGKCVTCPTNTVYIKLNNSCDVCPSGTFYSSNTKSCQTCPTGTSFNATLNICTNTTTEGHISCPKDKPYYLRYTKECSVCPQNQILDPDTHLCKPHNYISICPPDRPIYNITIVACVPCPKISTYDPVENVCKSVNCKDYQYFDVDTLKCVAISSTCSDQQYYDNATKKCQLLTNRCNPAAQVYSEGLQKCVPFNQTCSQGYYFDTNQKKCVSVATLCKFNQYYSYNKSECLPISSTCTIDQYYNETSFKCEQKSSKCTTDQVYAVQTHSCISKESLCTNSQFYSKTMHACVQGSSFCHMNEIYDKPTNSCKLISSLCQVNGTVYDVETNRCYKQCQPGYVIDKSTGQCIGTTSVTPVTPTMTCPQDETYLPETGKCVKTITTCKSQQFYNWKTYKCENPTFITSPYAANLLSQDRAFNQYETYYNSKVQSYSQIPDGLQDCPSSAPHYNPSTLSCMFCSSQNFLFDVVNNKCSKCPNGLIYSPPQHKCVQA